MQEVVSPQGCQQKAAVLLQFRTGHVLACGRYGCFEEASNCVVSAGKFRCHPCVQSAYHGSRSCVQRSPRYSSGLTTQKRDVCCDLTTSRFSSLRGKHPAALRMFVGDQAQPGCAQVTHESDCTALAQTLKGKPMAVITASDSNPT